MRVLTIMVKKNMWKLSVDNNMSKLIHIAEIIETRLRKEKELEFYQKQLEKIQQKMFFLKKDLDLTNLIIEIIEKEQVYDVREEMQKQLILGTKNDDDKT